MIRDVLSVISYLIGDLIYIGLILYSINRAQSISTHSSKEPQGYWIILAVLQGYLQCFVINIWPNVCAFVQYKDMRSAVQVRTQMMLSQEQMTSRRRKISSKKISVTQPSMMVDSSRQSSIDIEKLIIHKQSTVDSNT